MLSAPSSSPLSTIRSTRALSSCSHTKVSCRTHPVNFAPRYTSTSPIRLYGSLIGVLGITGSRASIAPLLCKSLGLPRLCFTIWIHIAAQTSQHFQETALPWRCSRTPGLRQVTGGARYNKHTHTVAIALIDVSSLSDIGSGYSLVTYDECST